MACVTREPEGRPETGTETPVAAVNPHELEIHDDVRIDNYYWLRDREDPAVIKYLEAENAYTESVMARTQGLQKDLYQEIIGRIKSGDQGSEVAHDMSNIANSLIQRGADILIAGCTEIPLVVSAERMTVPLISSTDILAERTVALCLGQTPLPAA